MERTKEAIDNYTGKGPNGKHNCSQAIAHTYNRYTASISEEELKLFGSTGGGRAPGQVCGAYFGAAYLLEKSRPELLPHLTEYFRKEAGYLKCREIRGNRSLPCKECVEKVAHFMSKAFPEAAG